ncbi:hypothetical protein MMC07_000037 [Pseudocyphellaria aurata]|nr:hypothetical protein [Pseudocyphellaria aurata]
MMGKHVILITDMTTLMDHTSDNLERMEQPTPEVPGDSISFEALSHNPTVLSNEVFEYLDPIILFRHPALLIPAYYRHCIKQIPGYSILRDRSVAVWTSLHYGSLGQAPALAELPSALAEAMAKIKEAMNKIKFPAVEKSEREQRGESFYRTLMADDKPFHRTLIADNKPFHCTLLTINLGRSHNPRCCGRR